MVGPLSPKFDVSHEEQHRCQVEPLEMVETTWNIVPNESFWVALEFYYHQLVLDAS